jgi:dihydrofolate synthase/folylpolyglutamate synthase
VSDADRPGARSDPAAIDEALRDLYLRSRGGAPRDPARTRRLLDRLAISDPANVVHVVGTNGKGGVAARIAAGLRAAGVPTLRYLSPHVERFHERIEVDGEALRDAELASFLARADAAGLEPAPAFFELVTALALDVAQRRGAAWAVLEAGVGAARDATSSVGGVRVTVVTNVAEDHLDVIGPDLPAAARDKAEAIRPGVPVVTAADGEALAILRTIAAQRSAPLAALLDGSAAFAWPDGAPKPRGGVAETSARLALAALRALALPADAEACALLAAVEPPALPARRERFGLVRGRTVLLDGAHNPSAARALAAELPPGAHLLLGVAARKDPAGVRAAFGPARPTVLTSALPGERPWGDDPAFVADPEAALAAALAALPPGGTLVVAGSFYLAGRLRPLLRARAAATTASAAQPR